MISSNDVVANDEDNYISIIIRSDSFPKLREMIDLALGLSAFNDYIKVFFVEKAVRILDSSLSINPLQSGERNIVKMLGMFELYDINNIYVSLEDWTFYGLTHDKLKIPVKVLSQKDLSKEISHAKHSFMG